jgi:transcriptional regulator with XRE-family HTH domain
VPSKDPWRDQLEGLGAFIRSQRRLANLSLRQLADLTDVSNPYLSQIERGLHEPSVRVLKSIARALNVSAETLLAQAGLLNDEEAGGASPDSPPATEAAIRGDAALTEPQKTALLTVYRTYLAENR